MTRAVLMTVALCLASVAHAQDEKATKVFSLTASPLHLIVPMAEVTGEVKLANEVGLAAIGGIGLAGAGGLYDVGGQGRYYLIGNFDRGMNLGAEVLYTGLSGRTSGVNYVASGISGGPFIGGKYALDVGLTFDGQLGIAVISASASAGGSTASQSSVIPLLNLNAGWSF